MMYLNWLMIISGTSMLTNLAYARATIAAQKTEDANKMKWLLQ